MNFKTITLSLAAVMSLCVSTAALSTGSTVFINGQQLSTQELYALQQSLGTYIAPGYYLLDGNGCWYNQTTGAQGCLSNGYNGSNGYTDANGNSVYTSRYGSGSHDQNGNWNHWSDAADGAVGGTSDGCIYTSFGWSNC
jgi:hypothetical protein